ncbi:dihydroorotase, homodimeric type [Kwoniella sp. CBS 6097]
MAEEIVLPSPADFHVHVRQGKMCELVTPQVAKGGVRTAYVMPNLVPPLTSTEAVLSYKAELERIDSSVQWLMTLYLHSDVTPAEIRKAAAAGVRGLKVYPMGITTNSDAGVKDYEAYYPVFEAMQEENLVLNLHGEVPSDAEKNISILNAEVHFLSHLKKLATDFPKLRIVLEHATTAAAIEAVSSLPDNVACTITAHHLSLTIDDVPSQPHHFCKPVAKEPKDRKALQDAIKSGNPKFFLGSDSAPHPLSSKIPNLTDDGSVSACAAGVYTSPILIPLVATLLESFGALDKLAGFVSENGRKFYGVPAGENQELKLRRTGNGEDDGLVQGTFKGEGVEVLPFWTGKKLGWEIVN